MSYVETEAKGARHNGTVRMSEVVLFWQPLKCPALRLTCIVIQLPIVLDGLERSVLLSDCSCHTLSSAGKLPWSSSLNADTQKKKVLNRAHNNTLEQTSTGLQKQSPHQLHRCTIFHKCNAALKHFQTE